MWIDYEAAHVPEDNPDHYEQVSVLMGIQGDLCGVCQRPMDNRKGGRVLDHDHHTGLTRGLLHQGCNIALGESGNGGDLHRAYLKNPPAGPFGWYYINTWGDVPERGMDRPPIDMERLREAMNRLRFAPRDDDPCVDPS